MATQLNEGAIHALFADPSGRVAQIVEQKALNVVSAAKALMLIPGAGHFYASGEYFLRRGDKVYHWLRAAPHTASAAGEPPSSDTGSLLGGLHHEMGVEETVFARVGAPQKYLDFLENGTLYMKPRPLLEPALDIGMAM